MARPYKNPSEILDERITIRITKSLKKKITAVAEASNLTENDVVRRKLNGFKIPHKERLLMIHEVRLLRQELARQGGLIKHLYSENPINKEEVIDLLKVQHATIKKISLLLTKFEREDINQEA